MREWRTRHGRGRAVVVQFERNDLSITGALANTRNGDVSPKEPAKHWNGAVLACLVVVVLVPITVRVPAVLVFIPPLMPLTPATFSRFVQFPTLVTCLFAVASVFLDCLVEFMLCVSDSALTSGLVFCLQERHGGAKQNRCKSD